MRIKIQQFLFGKNHSWSVVSKSLGRSFIKFGHDVEFVSTDGFKEEYCPNDLRPFIKSEPTGIYDLQLSYTAPHNWPIYLRNGNKNRFAIWNYEYKNKRGAKKTLLEGFSKFSNDVDIVLPSSNFSKEVFEDMKVPADKMVVVPHGVNADDFKTDKITELKTNKKIKILLNIAQPHRRKNLPAALNSFGKAFTKNDDVCLVAKVFIKNKGIKGKDSVFDVDFLAMLKTFESKFKNHAEVELVTQYISNIAEIYNVCQINFSATHAECFWLPGLEAMAAGMVNICPKYGGLLDFCNYENSLLVKGLENRAGREHQYWHYNPYAVHFEIDTNDAAYKLQKAVYNYNELIEQFKPNMEATVKQFSWDNAAKQILDLSK